MDRTKGFWDWKRHFQGLQDMKAGSQSVSFVLMKRKGTMPVRQWILIS